MNKRAVQISATGVLPSTPGLSHALRLPIRFLTRPAAGRQLKPTPTTPTTQPLPGITRDWFSLIQFRSPLLPESPLFSLPAGTEMFHFPAFPPHALCVQARVTAHDDCRVSPFGHPRITARLTTPRGLSRPPTSFIGSWYQGIHRAPLKTWPQMLASTMQFSNNEPSPTPTPHHEELQPAWPLPHTRKPHSRSLRTQQRAPHPPRSDPTFHTPEEAVLARPSPSRCRIANVPPTSNRAGHTPTNGQCSLERR